MNEMNQRNNLYKMILAALLCAIGIIIPLFSPIRIILEPASFTLASHVAIFIAMFISPGVAVAVSIGTTIGFFLGGFPIVIVARAATHVIFALLGSFALQKNPRILETPGKTAIFSLLMGLIHGAAEVVAVSPFYFNAQMTEGYYSQGFVVSILLLVGVGSVIHSMVDFAISLVIWRPLKKFLGLHR